MSWLSGDERLSRRSKPPNRMRQTRECWLILPIYTNPARGPEANSSTHTKPLSSLASFAVAICLNWTVWNMKSIAFHKETTSIFLVNDCIINTSNITPCPASPGPRQCVVPTDLSLPREICSVIIPERVRLLDGHSLEYLHASGSRIVGSNSGEVGSILVHPFFDLSANLGHRNPP